VIRTVVSKIRRVLTQTLRGFFADRGADLAASLTFSTLLMAVPLAATFALLLATFFEQNDRAILDAINFALPYQSRRLTQNLREFIASAQAVSGIGLLVLLATSLRLIFIVEDTVNHVWGAPRRKRMVQRMGVYTIGMFAGGMLLGVFVTGIEQLRRQIQIENVLGTVLFSRLAAALAVAAALTLVYRFTPNAPVSWRSAALAGTAVALLLRVIKYFFALYFKLFNAVNIIYGSLSLVLLLLLSLFLFWEFVLLGVEMTFVLDAGEASPQTRAGAGRVERAVRLLLALSDGADPARVEEMKKEVGAAGWESLTGELAACGLVRAEGAKLSLAVDLAEIPLSRVVVAAAPRLFAVEPEQRDRVARQLRRLFGKVTAEHEALLDVSLAEIQGRR
jgi:membrane protein